MSEGEKSKEPKMVEFKPITQGLGFHPFSDGLPYAPVNPAPPVARGLPPAGASAAGRPRYAPLPAALVPPKPQPVFESSVPAPVVAPYAAYTGETFGLTYLLKRASAYLVDLALNSVLCAGALALVLLKQHVSLSLFENASVALVTLLFLAAFHWALVAAQEVAFGTSAGKRLFGLGLNGSTWAVFLRALFFIVSAGFAGLGIFWALLDSRRRCWHDLISGVQPIEPENS